MTCWPSRVSANQRCKERRSSRRVGPEDIRRFSGGDKRAEYRVDNQLRSNPPSLSAKRKTPSCVSGTKQGVHSIEGKTAVPTIICVYFMYTIKRGPTISWTRRISQ